MRKIWEIAWLYLYQTYKDRSTLLYGFALPIIFTAVIGAGISGFVASQAEAVWRLAVVDLDQSEMSTQIVERLEADRILDVAPAAGTAAAERVNARGTPRARCGSPRSPASPTTTPT